ncbi:DUF3386 domain-containing protein [Prochlorococcus marinus]|uniref:DUF3386 domain-containing protein n=1 Tax=Prochlorococcus marinus (strain MIT 9211) TaxID=93059 RepID=A9BB95_PROM4|nr:DUF3386 domain-containing protein [Prochlorococcus marinus]ABX09107.1 Hypothetical protein P9211_11761 [Prochlorococcus marinus str. MIT 9211]
MMSLKELPDKPFEEKDCLESFRLAYENRYTWESDFPGYKGSCSYKNGKELFKGEFIVGKDLKASISIINNELAKKALASQLWEVCIHRVRRPFEKVHYENTFSFGDKNETGLEVLVGGKNKGDKYRIKDNVVTMVYRHVHGSLVNIFTKEVLFTGKGYLSKCYTSQYLNPSTKEPIGPESYFNDEYIPLYSGGPWVLSNRTIIKEVDNSIYNSEETYSFFDLEELSTC